ncbi:uncharacterized protein PFL1_05325 [Pseudozyma flocculosa PF-1]|uniref:SEC7 domain-containing protein n=1 Tax=Pseudozyma flocculosa PF-1 TaxID=1277687 RepID=A0A061H8Z7_9BASI|nr:uncharacterized protein PFL1_05325 [Pseudozyma flocculosa PF-1]EPQ27041.1 hypothetical protein PFL1_05325 [Pseudozyma flocculosa PF-1]
MLASAGLQAAAAGSSDAAMSAGQPRHVDALTRNGSIARSDAIAKLKRAASQREMRTKPPSGHPPGPQSTGSGGPSPAQILPKDASTPLIATEPPTSQTPSHQLGGSAAASPSRNIGPPTALAQLRGADFRPEALPLDSPPVSAGDAFSAVAPAADHLQTPTAEINSERSLSPLVALRDRAAARSPLPSLEQLRARILHEREAAGLQRSASTSAASQAARAYALEKLLGTSSTDRFYDHSKEGTLIERGAATPSPTLAKHPESSSDNDEGMVSDGATARSPRRDRSSLRRSRTIGGLSAMAEKQRKAAFVEGVFLAVPGANSNRLSRVRQQTYGLQNSTVDSSTASAPTTSPEPGAGPAASVAPLEMAAVTRSVSQRQIARTEMIRKLSTRGRATNASDVEDSQPSSSMSSLSASPLPFGLARRTQAAPATIARSDSSRPDAVEASTAIPTAPPGHVEGIASTWSGLDASPQLPATSDSNQQPSTILFPVDGSQTLAPSLPFTPASGLWTPPGGSSLSTDRTPPCYEAGADTSYSGDDSDDGSDPQGAYDSHDADDDAFYGLYGSPREDGENVRSEGGPGVPAGVVKRPDARAALSGMGGIAPTQAPSAQKPADEPARSPRLIRAPIKDRAGQTSAVPSLPPPLQTSGLNDGGMPSTPPSQPSFRHPASVPCDTSPNYELEMEDIRKSSILTISPGGINVPFRFFDHDTNPYPGRERTAIASRGQGSGDWPLSVDSSVSLPSGRESVDALAGIGFRGSGDMPPYADDGSGDNDRAAYDSIAPANSGLDAGYGAMDSRRLATDLDPSSISADGGRGSTLLTVPSLRANPSERLNAILGSSFVREYARDTDFDLHSRASHDEASSAHERVPEVDFLEPEEGSQAQTIETETEYVGQTSSGRSESGNIRVKAQTSDWAQDPSDNELDDHYLRKADRMAAELGRLTRETRANRLADEPNASAWRDNLNTAPDGHVPSVVRRDRGQGAAALPNTGQPSPSPFPPSPSQEAIVQATFQRRWAASAAATPTGAETGSNHPAGSLKSEASSSQNREADSGSGLRPGGGAASQAARRTHSHQASIDSLISALDAGGTLKAPSGLSRAASARTAVRVPLTVQAATSIPAPMRSVPATSGPQLTSLLSNDKLAPFPGLIPTATSGRAVNHSGPASTQDHALHEGFRTASAQLRSQPHSNLQSSQPHLQPSGSATPIAVPAILSPAPDSGSEKPETDKPSSFLTTLRRKASGAFVGNHARTGSKDGFWSRKASIKRSNSAVKAGKSGREARALKIEHPHHVGGPVQIISPWRHEANQNSPASVSTGGSPDILHTLGTFPESTSSGKLREDLEDGSADAGVSTAAAGATAGLAPATVAMARRYSRMLTDTRAPMAVPGVLPATSLDPPRKLLLDEPVFQVISATTIKDRYLFLFSDILVIAKPIAPPGGRAPDGEATKLKGAAVLPDSRWSFSVKNILELARVKVSITASSRRSPAKSRAKNPTLLAFVEHFAKDPEDAVRTLLARTKLHDSSASIGQLLYQTPELDRGVLTAYLTAPSRRDLLAAYVSQHRLTGVSIESGLRSLLLELRFPPDVKSFEAVLVNFARHWVACNAALVKPGFTFELASDLVFAIMALNDALHSTSGASEMRSATAPTTPGFFSEPCGDLSKADFLEVFRQHDPGAVLSDRTLGRIYLSVRSEPIAQALSADEDRVTIWIKGGKLPSRLTYGQPSQPVTLCIPAADPDLAIRLYAQDMTFEPPILTFGKSCEASFTMTSKSLGQKHVIFVRAGRNARLYAGNEVQLPGAGQLEVQGVAEQAEADVPLPRSLAVVIERAFMKHSFTITSHESDGAKRHFMLSFESEAKMLGWTRAIERSSRTLQADLGYGLGISAGRFGEQEERPNPSMPLSARSRRAADAIALQVLWETLVASDDAAGFERGPGLSRSATVHVPTLTTSRHPAMLSAAPLLDRQASTSRHYYAGGAVGQHERDLLIASSKASATQGKHGEPAAAESSAPKGPGAGHTKGAASLSSAPVPGDKRQATMAKAPEAAANKDAAEKKELAGEEVVTICRQNSLLPLVLAHLDSLAAGTV